MTYVFITNMMLNIFMYVLTLCITYLEEFNRKCETIDFVSKNYFGHWGCLAIPYEFEDSPYSQKRLGVLIEIVLNL